VRGTCACPAATNNPPLRRHTRYDEDPLRADVATEDLEEPVPAFSKFYVAMGVVEDAQLSARAEHWVGHMQWARRSSLVPELHSGQVQWEHTLLSPDCMTPVGQVVGISADDAAGALQLLASEPLAAGGGVSQWQVYRAHVDDSFNVTWPMTESQVSITPPPPLPLARISLVLPTLTPVFTLVPTLTLPLPLPLQVFVGTVDADMETQERFNAVKGATADFHGAQAGRVTHFARLTAVHDDGSEGDTGTGDSCETSFDTAGVLMVFNAKTNADARRFIASEPAVSAGLFQGWTVSPINVQDVDGQNHLMPRKFGERAVLDQVTSPSDSSFVLDSSLQILTPSPAITAAPLPAPIPGTLYGPRGLVVRGDRRGHGHHW
jgi:hypothetical protein